MTNWTDSDIPSQCGRTAVVTGTGGLGLETALALARAGASVILAGRNPSKGAAAIDRIRHDVVNANVWFEELDLANLDSIAAFGSICTPHLTASISLSTTQGLWRPQIGK